MRQFYRLQSSPGSDLGMDTFVGFGHLGDQLTCAQVLRLTAAQADTSLMPNSAASCRYVRPSALRARNSFTFPLVSLARG
jgi:hypothetical protein